MQERTIDAFWKRVERVQLTGCWLYTGYINKNRYGTWGYAENGKTITVYAHRFSYELLRGPVADGLVLDHLCKVRNCVNPDHLEPVTQLENVHRAKSWEGGAEFQRSKTHCSNGHEYAGDNLRIALDGRRSCRACGREYSRQSKLRNPQPRTPRTAKTHCAQGHEFTPENTRISSTNGQRMCVTCNREKVRRYRANPNKVVTHRGDTCKNGHPFDEDNTLVSNGQRYCRTCNRETMRAKRGSAEPLRASVEQLSTHTQLYKTHCKNGHEWTPENTVFAGSRRSCRQCRTERAAANA